MTKSIPVYRNIEAVMLIDVFISGTCGPLQSIITSIQAYFTAKLDLCSTASMRADFMETWSAIDQ